MHIKTAILGAICALSLAGAAGAQTLDATQSQTQYFIFGHDSDDSSNTVSGHNVGSATVTNGPEGSNYTVSFTTTPSPTITLTGVTGSRQTSFDAIWNYNVNVNVSILPSAEESCHFNQACPPPPPTPVAFADGVSTFSGTGFLANTIVKTALDEDDGAFCDASAGDCNFSQGYSAALDYRGDVLCVTIGGCLPGEEQKYAFTIPIQLEIQGHMFGGDGGAMTIVLDPTIRLNQDWFDAYGVDASQTTIVYDFGIAAKGGVPEPATWAMMLMGFGGLGVALRRRRQALALAA